MVHYKLDERQLTAQLRKLGFPTTSQFARRYDINRATLNNYLHGRGPFPESFYAIADALKMDPLLLLTPTTTEGDIPKLEEILPIVKVCSQVLPTIAIGLLGSHAVGNIKQYSDWDLGITTGADQLSAKEFLRIQRIVEDLRENLSRDVHVVNLNTATVGFLKGINYVPRFLSGDSASWAYFMGTLHGVHKAS